MSKLPDGCFAPPGSDAWYCKRRQILRELPERYSQSFQNRATRRAFQSRDLLFSRAATSGLVHVLAEGRVRLSSFDADGDETQLAILEAGEAFREPAHRAVEPISLCAEGLADGSLLTVEFDELRELAEEAPEAFATLVTALD